MANVSQAFGSPVLHPDRNHFSRCTGVPWVNMFWLTCPVPRFFWIQSSPMRAATCSAAAMSCRLMDDTSAGSPFGPGSVACAARTPAEQSACNSSRTESDFGTCRVCTFASVPSRSWT